MSTALQHAALRVDGRRLWHSLMEMARIGATPKGGVCRLALSDADKHGRDLFTRWCIEAGCEVRFDAIGNLFARRAAAELPPHSTIAPIAPIAMGSHLDSQPTGGKFDGVYGVLAALEVIRTLNDHRIQTRSPLEICVWTNEEGARFAPAMLGSAVFAGNLPLEQALATTDARGLSIAHELRRIGYAGPIRSTQRQPGVHLELHIEQGPVLENERKQIGVVTGVQGIRWYDVVITGTETHAGPTPMPLRKDPVQSAIALIADCYSLAATFAPDARVTIGELQAWPGSRNTVPGKVRFTLDLRHPDNQILTRMDGAVRALVVRAGTGPCDIALTPVWVSEPVVFAQACTSAVRAAAGELGYSHRDIVSGAGHDSVNLSRILPAGMIFIPCLQGVSHNEQESISPQQAEAGANVLLHAVLKLDELQHA
jgi:N-carbamoyl-L-amino-acid hydrolase